MSIRQPLVDSELIDDRVFAPQVKFNFLLTPGDTAVGIGRFVLPEPSTAFLFLGALAGTRLESMPFVVEIPSGAMDLRDLFENAFQVLL